MLPEDSPLCAPRLARIPIRESGEALVDVRTSAPLRVAGPAYLRYGLVDRLVTAQSLLPRDLRLLIVDGYHPPGRPCSHPACAIPSPAAPHPTGGAVDLTLSAAGEVARPLPACCTGPVLPPDEGTGQLLTSALIAAGLVTHPARWWHWSYGDRFWAWVNQAPHARYGPVPAVPEPAKADPAGWVTPDPGFPRGSA